MWACMWVCGYPCVCVSHGTASSVLPRVSYRLHPSTSERLPAAHSAKQRAQLSRACALTLSRGRRARGRVVYFGILNPRRRAQTLLRATCCSQLRTAAPTSQPGRGPVGAARTPGSRWLLAPKSLLSTCTGHGVDVPGDGEEPCLLHFTALMG